MKTRTMKAAAIAVAAIVAGAVPVIGRTAGASEAAGARQPVPDAALELTAAPAAAATGAAEPANVARENARSLVAPRRREYWIKAVNVRWDVVPNGKDALHGIAIPAEKRILTAVVYRAYTRGWKRRLPNTAAAGDNDGIPGPVIEARVGDEVIVHFKNEDRHYRQKHSMHFHAFTYAPASDGAFIPQVSGRGANVPVGRSFTYRLVAGPQSYGTWPYHDHSSTMHDSIPRGLYGAVVIYRRNEALPDRRFVVAFGEHLGFNTINGRAFVGNVPTFRARTGETVEWNVLAVGELFHTFHPHGHRWISPGGVPIDNQDLGPGSSFRIRWKEDAPGNWLYHCHVESHQMNGMIGLYRVSS
ncbi:MAG: multicopper oxidase domain-containing protein [Thermoleophilia bacterium]|nr:multicopper oxidase domain-containing protein [Thermoleophilia bacterium]